MEKKANSMQVSDGYMRVSQKYNAPVPNNWAQVDFECLCGK